MKRILSGVQPTGIPHIGNYFGALKPWVRLQQQHQNKESFYCIVDLHSLTSPQHWSAVRDRTIEMAATFAACGLDFTANNVFVQSKVPQHTELHWLLSCVTPMGALKRMTQFKEKSQSMKDNACLGLFSYPVLQAADILLYQATHVPVGEDQKQHLELAQRIANSFNHTVQQEVFAIPSPIIGSGTARVLDLRDASRKMSKSKGLSGGKIELLDSDEDIQKKIRKAKTDASGLFVFDPEQFPEKSNLLVIFSEIVGRDPSAIAAEYEGKTTLQFKEDLSEALISELKPIRESIQRHLSDQTYIREGLAKGALRAQEVAVATMDHVKGSIGLY